jgi:hypothetical protein
VISIEKKIGAVQAQMRSRLDEIRSESEHSLTKGQKAEEPVRDFLREYLPSTYRVGHGEIIDLHSRVSRQLDVVVTDQDHPFTFSETESALFFIESVVAVAEVKTTLTRAELRDAAKKADSVRELEAKIAKGTLGQMNVEDQQRYYASPPFFVFAYEGPKDIGKVKEWLAELKDASTDPRSRQIDAVFILDTGYAIDFGTGHGSFVFIGKDGQRLGGWRGETRGEIALYSLLGWLSTCAPRLYRFQSVFAEYFSTYQP